MRAHSSFIAQSDPSFYVRTLRRDDVDERAEGHVEDHVFVVGVIDDERDLIGEKPRVDRVANGAHTGHAVVALQVTVAVPGQRADALALLDAEPDEGLRKLFRAFFAIAPGVPVHVAFDTARDDLRAR